MGICFEGRNKRSNTFNQNIAQNMYFTNNYNNMNSSNNNGFINNFPLTNCCCPSCGEPAGINFQGSGEDYDAFNCLKCGKNKIAANYYKCKICNGIFCSQCPFNNNKIINKKKKRNNFSLYSCPACGEPAGANFQGSGEDYDSFNCLKCGKNQAAANYYKCEICYGIFCSQCPKKKDGKLARCPSCGEMAGNSFQGSGEDYDSFDCLKCGKTQCAVNYYKCNVCRGMFCYYCPFDYD